MVYVQIMGYPDDYSNSIYYHGAIVKCVVPINISQYYLFNKWFVLIKNLAVSEVFIDGVDTKPDIPSEFLEYSDVPESGVTMSFSYRQGTTPKVATYTVPQSEFQGKNILQINTSGENGPRWIDPTNGTVVGYFFGVRTDTRYGGNKYPDLPNWIANLQNLPYTLKDNGRYLYFGQ